VRLQFWKNNRKDRRLDRRIEQPAVTAFYWTGGVPRPYRVRNIGVGGAYIETEDPWDMGSLVHVVLEYGGASKIPAPNGQSLGLWVEIARVEPGGMGVEFVLASQEQTAKLQKFLEKAPRVAAVEAPDAKATAAGE
jgi:hypothetical protein